MLSCRFKKRYTLGLEISIFPEIRHLKTLLDVSGYYFFILLCLHEVFQKYLYSSNIHFLINVNKKNLGNNFVITCTYSSNVDSSKQLELTINNLFNGIKQRKPNWTHCSALTIMSAVDVKKFTCGTPCTLVLYFHKKIKEGWSPIRVIGNVSLTEVTSSFFDTFNKLIKTNMKAPVVHTLQWRWLQSGFVFKQIQKRVGLYPRHGG